MAIHPIPKEVGVVQEEEVEVRTIRDARVVNRKQRFDESICLMRAPELGWGT